MTPTAALSRSFLAAVGHLSFFISGVAAAVLQQFQFPLSKETSPNLHPLPGDPSFLMICSVAQSPLLPRLPLFGGFLLTKRATQCSIRLRRAESLQSPRAYTTGAAGSNNAYIAPTLQRRFNVLGQEYASPEPLPDDKVFIALSSGVDSSTAAALLVKEYKHPIHNLHPLYMANWDPSISTPFDTNSARRAPRNKPSLLKPVSNSEIEKRTKCTTREFGHVRELCKFLGLREPLYLNFEKEYWHDVFKPMVDGYEAGKTPNPDVSCNRWVKFGRLFEKLEEESRVVGLIGKWWLATGHYANIGYPSSPPIRNIVPHLLRSRDRNKDQTFYLSTIQPSSLDRLFFPLSSYDLTKNDVYSLAREWSLPGWSPGESERPESMGLCFIEPGGGQGAAGFRLFLNEFLPPKPGNIVVGPDLPPPQEALKVEHVDTPKNSDIGVPPRAVVKTTMHSEDSEKRVHEDPLKPGTIIGKHAGLWTATIGEKAHLDLPQGDKRYQGRWYVSRKVSGRNEIEVVRGWWNGRLWSWGMILRPWSWLGDDCEEVSKAAILMQVSEACIDQPGNAVEMEKRSIWEPGLVVQFRHRQKPISVRAIEVERDAQADTGNSGPITVKIWFSTPQRAVAPGQSAALWWRQRCLGGGVIDTTMKRD